MFITLLGLGCKPEVKEPPKGSVFTDNVYYNVTNEDQYDRQN